MTFTWDLAGAKTQFEICFDASKETVIRIPVSKTISNITGDETLTDGTPDTAYECIFHRKQDQWALDNPGKMQNADAIVIVKTSATLNVDDKITRVGEDYRVEAVVTDYLFSQNISKNARVFKI